MSEQVGEWGLEPPICNLLVSQAVVIIFIMNVLAGWRSFIDAAWVLKSKEVDVL
jgi:hypothetical protein